MCIIGCEAESFFTEFYKSLSVEEAPFSLNMQTLSLFFDSPIMLNLSHLHILTILTLPVLMKEIHTLGLISETRHQSNS